MGSRSPPSVMQDAKSLSIATFDVVDSAAVLLLLYV